MGKAHSSTKERRDVDIGFRGRRSVLLSVRGPMRVRHCCRRPNTPEFCQEKRGGRIQGLWDMIVLSVVQLNSVTYRTCRIN
jgi:hypothetical protein